MDMRMAGYVVGIGAANLDVHGRSINSIKLRDSNLNCTPFVRHVI